MKLGGRDYLALMIAGISDLADLLFFQWVPGVGEPLDIGTAIVNSVLLKSPIPLIGLVEVAPVVVVDFLPIHSISAWMAIQSRGKLTKMLKA